VDLRYVGTFQDRWWIRLLLHHRDRGSYRVRIGRADNLYALHYVGVIAVVSQHRQAIARDLSHDHLSLSSNSNASTSASRFRFLSSKSSRWSGYFDGGNNVLLPLIGATGGGGGAAPSPAQPPAAILALPSENTVPNPAVATDLPKLINCPYQ